MIIIEANPITKFINYFFALNPYEMSVIANIISTLMAIPLTLNQQNTLGNFLELMGQQILLIQAQGSLLAPQSINQTQINEILKNINFKFEYIEEVIIYLKEAFFKNNRQ